MAVGSGSGQPHALHEGQLELQTRASSPTLVEALVQ
ncbi:hypothetical protein CI610_02267 [invertebrate metagenome]|uniref:Uncharacterized protein n=1 Tax=invertebrate metagenome TaxID=1711999 RepID=A0A2H9T6E8_9ZZZZ